MKQTDSLINIFLVTLGVLLLSIVASCGEQGEEPVDSYIFLSGNVVNGTDVANRAIGISNALLELYDASEVDHLFLENRVSNAVTGSYSFTQLSPGDYEITISHDDYSFDRQSVDIITCTDMNGIDFVVE